MKIKHYTHAIIMILVFIGAVSVYGAWYAAIGRESASALSLQSQIQTKTEIAASAQTARSQLTKALSDQASITGYFVSTNNIVPYLSTLQSTGAKYGTKVEVVSVTSQPAQPHTLLQLSLRITGPFDSVERTLGAIEYEPYDTTITNVTLDTPGGAGTRQWTAAVTMNVGTIDSNNAAAATTTTPTP